jgi:integrase
MNGCRNYLLTKAVSRHGEIGIARNTALGYFNKVIACLNQAYRQGLISNLPHLGLDAVKWEDIEKEYLTMEELKRLIATPSRDTELSRAFIFSCLTGLRVSDVTKLTWKEVSWVSDLPRITFTQKKTSKLEYLDITPQALPYMGERGRPEEKVFRFRYGESTGYKLREWADRAGINKHISFHSGRHTFAVMMLELGTDIYTLQKLMGHKKIETTMVYAKILDKSKQQAVLKIPDLSKK